MDLSFNIGGAAGQGIDTIGDLLTQVFVKAGFYTFTIKDYESRIRGGYNFTQVRVSDRPVFAPADEIDVIVALTLEGAVNPRKQLVKGGVIILDESVEIEDREPCHFSAPLEKTAKEIGGSDKMTNAAALGALLSVLNFPFSLLEESLRGIFQKKGDKVVTSNVAVAKALYDLTSEKFKGTCKTSLSSIEKGPCKDRLIMTGNTAIALGAMAANVKWASAYPMSPSTGMFQDIITNAQRLTIGALQPEDEIAAMCMAVGASYAGARSIVATSGGGFCLKVESLGLAAMTETPIVIYEAQRPGPSTGLPTRTEQGDLLFVAFASQGEFPRIMIAPKDPVEAFETAGRAFNLAEYFQVPVIIMGDQFMAESSMNIPRLDVTKIQVDRGKLEPPETQGLCLRYRLTDDGISPRSFPGDKGKIVVANGNLHFENGHITEDAGVRKAMVEKFLKKVPGIRAAMRPPTLYGKKNAKTTLLTWGSSWGAVYEAMSTLAGRHVSVNQLHYCDVYPPKTELLRDIIEKGARVISVEGNATSQFASLVRMESGLTVETHVNKYDGRPLTRGWVLSKLKEVGVA